MNHQKMELRQQETLEAIASLRLLEDELMTVVFSENVQAAELMLQIILQRDDLKVLEVETQRLYKNPVVDGRSIILDIYAQDVDGKVYGIEVQRADNGADAHRARFISSMIDTRMLQENQKFKELCDSYVIFITENDVMKSGHGLYHVNRMVRETGKEFWMDLISSMSMEAIRMKMTRWGS